MKNNKELFINKKFIYIAAIIIILAAQDIGIQLSTKKISFFLNINENMLSNYLINYKI